MRSVLEMVGLTVVLVILLACPGKEAGPPELKPGDSAVPGATYDVRAALSAALSCPTGDITWDVVEPACGSVAAGFYTAPPCGSICVPGTAHVRGTGCGRVAEVAIIVAEEIVSLRMCPTEAMVAPGATVQLYARVEYSCPGHVEWSPAAPPVGTCPP